VQETVASPEIDLRFEVDGDAGYLPGDLATPLAVVLNELMQNAVDHAFPGEATRRSGRVSIQLARRDGELVVDVDDDGVGIPAGFSLHGSHGLGLSIVQALVTTELDGTIVVERGLRGGTHVRVQIPVRPTGAGLLESRPGPRPLDR